LVVSPDSFNAAMQERLADIAELLVGEHCIVFDVQPMNLVVFDLDGILTDYVGADEECLVQAFADAYEIDELDRTGRASGRLDSFVHSMLNRSHCMKMMG
jgi:hypothetical protein